MKKQTQKPTPKRSEKSTAKKAATKPSKSVGGAVSKTKSTTAKVDGKSVPANAIVMLSDEEFSAGVIDELKARFDRHRIAKEFDDLMKAEYENRFGERSPDAKARLATLEKIVYLTVGKPLERVQKIQTTTYTIEELQELIEHSQALRLAMREMLRPYDAEDGAAKL